MFVTIPVLASWDEKKRHLGNKVEVPNVYLVCVFVSQGLKKGPHAGQYCFLTGINFLPHQITVGIRASIISVGDIDTVGQQFKCDFYLSACWPEPRLQGRSPSEVNIFHICASEKYVVVQVLFSSVFVYGNI